MKEEAAKKLKVFFVHIPKTGGSWFEKTMIDYMASPNNPFPVIASYMQPVKLNGMREWPPSCVGRVQQRFGGHASIHQCQEAGIDGFDEYLKVSICRNPFDMLTSLYHDTSDDSSFSKRYKDWKGPSGWASLNIAHGIRSFDDFVKKFCDPEFPWLHKDMKTFLFHQQFQYYGLPGVDIILRSEALNLGTAELLRKCHKRNIHLDLKSEFSEEQYNEILSSKRERVSKLKRKKDYRRYYTDELRELVEHACSAELQLFHYDFDGIKPAAQHDGSLIDPAGTFYMPSYPLCMLGFSNEMFELVGMCMRASLADARVDMAQMSPIVDTISKVPEEYAMKMGMPTPTKSCLYTATNHNIPKVGVEILWALGWDVYIDPMEWKTNLIDSKIYTEWYPQKLWRNAVGKEELEEIVRDPTWNGMPVRIEPLGGQVELAKKVYGDIINEFEKNRARQ